MVGYPAFYGPSLCKQLSNIYCSLCRQITEWMFLVFEIGIIGIMYVWFRARKIKNRYVELVRLEDYIPLIQTISRDRTVPKYTNHLVYLTSSDNRKEVEHKIVHSILGKAPKRADVYWLVHVHTTDDPYTREYKVSHILPNGIIRVELKLGFRVDPDVHLMFRYILAELMNNKEVIVPGSYDATNKINAIGDFHFIVMEKYLSSDNELPVVEKLIMDFYFRLKKMSLSEARGFGLDRSNLTIEQFPLMVSPVPDLQLKRIELPAY
jgi:KUP system potassium uptake protein